MPDRHARAPQRRRAGAAPRDEADAKAGAARTAILAAARAEFAAKGLTGARVNVIAARAGVNKQLIYYYYGSKDDLYRTALETVYGEIRRLERGLELAGLPPRQAMARLVGFSFDYLLEHPDFIGLLNHENAHGAAHVRRSRTIRRTHSPLIELIRSTLERGVESNVFRRGVDPVELYIAVAGMSYFFFSNRLTLASIFGRDLSKPRSIASYRRHIVALVMNGLRP
jgi:TetR/AcrR family transcriptional regulator